MKVSTSFKKKFRRFLLSWYDKNKRTMPWRETQDPYRIWIAEVMLQQTQVATVKDYYYRFISHFPTIGDLAQAKRDDVMKICEGLGYYARVRNLHKSAKIIFEQFGGKIPSQRRDLLALPGIGRYTAGALLSIAFNKPEPILDANVLRVLSRVFQITDNVNKSTTQDLLWFLATSLLTHHRVRDFNEAMMELGSTLCKSQNPQCINCPLTTLCKAKQLGIQDSLPVRPSPNPIPYYQVTAGIIWKGHRFLIARRPPKGLLGGLWEFPGGKQEKGETLEDCLRREIREEMGVQIKIRNHLVSVNHAYTHFRITLHAYECQYQSGKVQSKVHDDSRWIPVKALDDFAFPGADRKVIKMLLEKTMGDVQS